jgi:hypothetical protein
MSMWALIIDGVVHELTAVDPTHRFAPALVWADVSDVAGIAPGWSAAQGAGGWTFAPPAPPAPTLPQQAAAQLAAGLIITSGSAAALNGTYPCDDVTQSEIQAEMISLLANGTFADGGTTIAWADTSGAAHTMTPTQFKAVATAIGAFVAGSVKVMKGQSATLPAATAAIA